MLLPSCRIYTGPGDSGGDFADGDWETWQSDLAAVARWCLELGHPVTGLLAVRLGCALAVASADKGFIPAVRNSVLWQPVFEGNRFLSQFLRMRVASGLMQARKETVADLRIMLQNFKEVEVGGYLLSKRLADDIECIAVPDVLPQSLGRVSWLRVTRQSDTPLPAVSQELVERTQSRGGIVHVVCASGEPFWSATEITLNADLVGESIALFCKILESRQRCSGLSVNWNSGMENTRLQSVQSRHSMLHRSGGLTPRRQVSERLSLILED